MLKKHHLPDKGILIVFLLLAIATIFFTPHKASANALPRAYSLNGNEPVGTWTPENGGSVVVQKKWGWNALWGGSAPSFAFYTDIDVQNISTIIDLRQVYAYASVYQANYSGDKDSGNIRIAFLDANKAEISYSDTGDADYDSSYTLCELTDMPVPSKTRYIRVELLGTREAGDHCDAYFASPTFYLEDKGSASIAGITCDTAEGTYTTGATVNYSVTFNEPVSAISGDLLMNLTDNNGDNLRAKFTSLNAAKDTAYYTFTVDVANAVNAAQRQNHVALFPVGIGADTNGKSPLLKDAVGNETVLTDSMITKYMDTLNGLVYLDFKKPNIVRTDSNAPLGTSYWNADEKLTFTVVFDEPVKFAETPLLTLSNGSTANYETLTGDDSTKLSFSYTIQQGDNINGLFVTKFTDGGLTDMLGNTRENTAVDTKTKYNIRIDTSLPEITFTTLYDTMINKSEQAMISNLYAYATDYSGISQMYYVWSQTTDTPSFNGVAQGNATGQGWELTVLPTSTGTYYLFAKAVDATGKEVIVQSPYTYKLDLAAPTITAAVDNAQNVKSVVLSCTDDSTGVNANYFATGQSMLYRWTMDGSAYATKSGYAKSGDSIALPTMPGTYSLSVNAYDLAGNGQTTNFPSLTIVATALSIAISPESSYDYKSSYSVNINMTAANIVKRAYYWNYSSTPNSNAGYILSGGTQLASNNETITNSTLDGAQYLHVYAQDSAYNYYIQSAGPFYFDKSAPTVFISPNGTINTAIKDRYIVTLNIYDNHLTADQITKKYVVSSQETCPVDQLVPFTGTSLVVDVLSGAKYLYVQLTDSAGNTSTTKSNIFTPKNAKPTGSISYAENRGRFTASNTVNSKFYAINNDNYRMQAVYEVDGVLSDFEDIVVGDIYIKQFTISDVYGYHTIRVKYRTETGIESDFYDVQFYYDNIPPEITITADRTDPMIGIITLTATVADDPVYNDYYEYCEWVTPRSLYADSNGTFTFTAKDPVGNITTKTYTVTNIDRQAPKVTFASEAFDALRHKSATVNITATDDLQLASATYSLRASGVTYIDRQPFAGTASVPLDSSYPDGMYTITVEATDAVGRSVRVASNIIYLDNTPLETYISYSTESATPNAVAAYLQTYADDVMTVTNNGGSPVYTFTENGTFTFNYIDVAGNVASKTAQVTWIDKSLSKITYTVTKEDGTPVSGYAPINQNLIVTLYPTASDPVKMVSFNFYTTLNEDDIESIGAAGEYKYLVKRSGILRYNLFSDATGTGSEIVLNIDKDPPTLRTISYSATNPTDQDVVATIYTNDASQVTYQPSRTVTFTQNGTQQVIATDAAGNKAVFEMTVNNIYKDTPVPVLTYTVDGAAYDTAQYTTKCPMVTVAFQNAEQNAVTILNNSGKNTYTFTDNGSFEFQFSDSTGKLGSVVATISKYDINPPTGTISYSTIKTTNGTVTATLTTTDNMPDAVTVTNNNGSNVYTFTKNGSFTFDFKDAAGNIGHATATISIIDDTPLELTYSTYVDSDKAASGSITITANRAVRPVGGQSWESYSTSYRYYVTSNGTYNYTYEDTYGRTASVSVVFTQIYEPPFEVILEYSTTEPTSSDVVATLRTADPYQSLTVKNNGGKVNYRFTQNGEFAFVYADAKGKEYTKTAVVSNIDKSKAKVTVAYSTLNATRNNVVATLTTDKDVTFPDGLVKLSSKSAKYTFQSNGKLIIGVKDATGNTTNVTLEVTNIDTDSPVITFEKEAESIPNGTAFDFLAGVSATDYSGIDGTVTYTNNVDLDTPGDYTVTYTAKDKAGNITQKTKKISVYNASLFGVIVNGQKAKGDMIVLETKTMNIKTVNNGSNVKCKLLSGKKAKGDFKAGGVYITSQYTFAESGIYTIFVTDDEMNSQLIQLSVK